jgi:hypothetical protein
MTVENKSGGPAGRCRLCLREKQLQDSHLVPKAVYRRLRIPSGDNPNPVIMTRKRAYATSKQIRDYLLCSECEQRFHANGEDWVLRHYDRGNSVFRLQKMIADVKPVLTIKSVRLIPTTLISGVDIKRLQYLATSVIWRAGVHKWRLDDHEVKPIDIRPDHLEDLRLFLIGETDRLAESYLWVSVAAPGGLPEATFFTPPYGGFDKDHYSFRFIIPGMMFALFMGPLVQPMVREFCSVRSADRVLHLTSNIEQAFLGMGMSFYETSQEIGHAFDVSR